jgi:ribose-phosphate pyrophosphokinase
MIVLGGSSSLELAAEVSQAFGYELGVVRVKRFPDGELFLKIESDVKNEDVVVIQSTSRPQDESLMELFFMMGALVDLGAKIACVVPYYGYGRQDRAFSKGEAVSSRTIAKHIGLSAKRFITINPHKDYILNYFSIPAKSLDAAPLIGEYFKEKALDCPLVVAPDSGSKGLAEKVAHVIDCKSLHCEKKRLGPGKVVTSADDIKLNGEDVIIVDDIIDSGGTIVEAAKALRKRGAGSIRVACIHPVLTGSAAERIKGIADELVATNTIRSDYSKISVAPLIAEAFTGRN